MKLRRLLAFVFGASAALALCSCDEDKPVEPTPPVVDSGNENTGGNENTSGNENTGGNDTPAEPAKTQGELIVAAVKKQIEASNTITITVTQESNSEETFWDYNEDEELVSKTEKDDDCEVFEFTIAKTEDSFAIKVVNTYDYYDFDDELITVSKESFIIDEYFYAMHRSGDFYVAEEIEMDEFADVEDVISDAMANVEITEEDKAALVAAVVDLANKTIDITTNKITLTADVMPIYNAIVSYINDIDGNTKTLEGIINDVLTLVDPTLKATDLIDAGVIVGKMTVNEALTAIDAFLTENYQTTIQGIYDAILVNETFVDTLTSILVEEGMTEQEVTQMLEQYKLLKISDMVADYKDITLYDLALSFILASNGSEEDFNAGVELVSEESSEDEQQTLPTIDEFAAMLKQMIAAPINQLDSSILANIKGMLKMTVFKEFKNVAEIEFNADYEIAKITNVSTIDVTNTTPNYYDNTKVDVKNMVFKHTIEILLSNDVTTIALPKDAVIVNDPNSDVKVPESFDCLEYYKLFKNDSGLSTISTHDYDDDVYLGFVDKFDGIPYINDLILTLNDISQDGKTYSFTILDCYISNCGERIASLAGGNLQALSSTEVTLIFDRTTGELEVNIPTIDNVKLEEIINS